jgi:hypothetical protein
MDSTLRNVSDQNNTTSPLKLSTTGVQIESPLRITTSDASGFYLDAEDSATNNRFSIKRDPSSQEVTLDFASNPTGSTSLVGAIRTYQDGVNLSNAMSFIEDGSVGIGTNTPIGILHLKRTAANTRLAIDGDAGFNRLISYRTAGLQRFGLYVNNTAESGSNAGSDFAIRAYNDAGTLLTTPVFIKRSTGNVGIGTTNPFSLLTVGGQSSFYSVQSAGTGSDFFYSDINPNLTAGANNQVVSLVRLRDRGASNTGGFTGTKRLSLLMENVGGGDFPFQLFSETGALRIGYSTIATPTAQLEIRGSGSTSATTSLLVQNSAGSDLIRINDVGLLQFGGTTSSFPAFKRVGTGIELRSADDTINGEPTFTSFNFQVRNLFFGSDALIFGYSGGTTGFRISNVGAASFGVGVTDAVASAQLEIVSTTKGFLPPRMTNAQRAAIASPAVGLMVYCTDAVEGLYVYKSTGWTFVI